MKLLMSCNLQLVGLLERQLVMKVKLNESKMISDTMWLDMQFMEASPLELRIFGIKQAMVDKCVSMQMIESQLAAEAALEAGEQISERLARLQEQMLWLETYDLALVALRETGCIESWNCCSYGASVTVVVKGFANMAMVRTTLGVKGMKWDREITSYSYSDDGTNRQDNSTYKQVQPSRLTSALAMMMGCKLQPWKFADGVRVKKEYSWQSGEHQHQWVVADGVQVVVRCAELPPSCVVEMIDEVVEAVPAKEAVPASVRKVMKVKCGGAGAKEVTETAEEVVAKPKHKASLKE
jgi:hypothetical protein